MSYAPHTLIELPDAQYSTVVLASTLYFVGLLGMIYNYKNYLITMMSVELMYLGAITNFVLYGSFAFDRGGSIYGLVLLILAACESAVGLGLLILMYRFGRSIEFTAYEALKG